VSPTARPEELDVAAWCRLTDSVRATAAIRATNGAGVDR
jgi:hypothetical protein